MSDIAINVRDIQVRMAEREAWVNSYSKWNYALPALAAIAWVGSIFSAIALLNYKYFETVENPDRIEQSGQAAMWLAVSGASAIPVALAVTVIKAGCIGCANLAKGCQAATNAFAGVFKESFVEFGERPGIFINTLGALPFSVYALIASCR